MFSRKNLSLYLAVLSVNLLVINTASVFSWASPSIPILTSNDPTINPLGRPIETFEESCVAILPTLGAILGILLSGYLGEILGRRKTLAISSLPFPVCLIVLANARHIYLFFAVRLILGICSGSIVNLIPSYVGEISEVTNRGAMGSVFGVMSNIGSLITFGIGPLLSIKTFAYIFLVPVCLFLLTFIFCVPETPHFFIAKDDIDKAKQSLQKIRNNSDIEKELVNLIRLETESKQNKKASWKDVTSSSTAKKGLLVTCGLFISQQLTGISFMFNYLQPILNSSGNVIPSSLVSLIVGIVQLFSSSLSALLVDRLGRKILLYVSAVGSSVPLVLLGVYFALKDRGYKTDTLFWLPVICIIIYFIFFNIGYAALPWVMCGELFHSNVKSFCVTISAISCFSFGFLGGASFPFLRDAFGQAQVFMVFGSLTGLTCIFIYLVVPETKGKTVEEIFYKK